MFLPVCFLAQKWGLPSLGPSMCLLGDGHVILRGIWNLFFRNKYSGQFMSKNEINILACHETKRNTAYIDDLIINEHNMKKFTS
jgi:hypothetical protein